MNCKEAGKLGGIARSKKLSKARRLEISRLANLKKEEHKKNRNAKRSI